MSTISQLNYLSATSSLLSATYSTSKSSASSLTNDLYSALTSSYSSYGTNTASTSSNISSYLVDVKSDASKISSSLKALSDKSSSSKFDKVDVSSDNAAVSSSYSGSELLNDFTVDVHQLATTQKNEGTSLSKNSISNLGGSTGATTSLTLSANGKSVNIDVYAGPTATNLDVQNKLAQKINDANMGVKATVTTDSKTGTSKLVLESSKTGEENGFSVSGNLADALGITNTTQEAQNAIYSVNNGELQYSSSNTAKTSVSTKSASSAEVSLTLSKTTDKSATVSSKASTTSSINAVRDLVNNFNSLLDTAQSMKDSGASRLETRLTGLASSYSAALSRVGITTNSSGFLQIDEDKMKTAAENGDLKKLFNTDSSSSNYGFANRLGSLASSVEKNPSNFLSLGAKDELKYSTESRYQYDSGYSSYNSYKSYYTASYTGMLFDAMF